MVNAEYGDGVNLGDMLYEHSARESVEHWYMPERVDRDVVRFKAKASKVKNPHRTVWVHPHGQSENCTFKVQGDPLLECYIVDLNVNFPR